jgi:hypothetical protein
MSADAEQPLLKQRVVCDSAASRRIGVNSEIISHRKEYL